MGNLLRRLGWITWVVILGFVSLATGVATNQVLNNGQWNRTWLIIAICCAVLLAATTVLGARFGTPENGARGLANGKLRRLYLRQTHASVRYMEAVGFATRGPFSLDMRHVYVDVSLMPRTHEAAGEPFVGAVRATPGERRSLHSFLETGSQVLVVIGGPGSGKTTMVRHTTLEMTRGRRFWRRERLPVLLYLRDHATTLAADELPSLAGAAVEAAWLQNRVPDSWLEEQLERGHCLVLFDGLDEIADTADRARTAAWVKQQIARHPGNQYVLTSRPHGYSADPIDTADVVQVRRFTADQVREFLHNWYLATERRATGTTDPEVTAGAARKADDLLERLRATPALTDLAANPLLLTMIANVHLYRGALPGGRADLYREMCDVLLHRRQEAKGLPDPTELRGGQKEHVVRHLAWTLMNRQESTVPAHEAVKIIKTVLRRVSRRVSPQAFLTACTESGLLVERESGVLAFAHLTLQEYLAAAYIADTEQVAVLGANVDTPWWRETTLLWAANADATRVLRACLASNTVQSLALAFDVLDEAQSVDDEVRDELEALLSEASASGGRADLIRSVMTTRLLRDVRGIGGGVMMCARPVTRDLYRLFVADERLLGHMAHPALPEDGDAPVGGLWDGDIRRFLKWLLKYSGGESYRLPDGREALNAKDARLVEVTARPVWTGSLHDGPLLDLSAEEGAGANLWPVPGLPEKDLLIAEAALGVTHLPGYAVEDYARGVRLRLGRSPGSGPERAAADVLEPLVEALFLSSTRDLMVRNRDDGQPPELDSTRRQVLAALLAAHKSAALLVDSRISGRLESLTAALREHPAEEWAPNVQRALTMVLEDPEVMETQLGVSGLLLTIGSFVHDLPGLLQRGMPLHSVFVPSYIPEQSVRLSGLQAAAARMTASPAERPPDLGQRQEHFLRTLRHHALSSGWKSDVRSLLLSRWAGRVLEGCHELAVLRGEAPGTTLSDYVRSLVEDQVVTIASGQEAGTWLRTVLRLLRPGATRSDGHRCAWELAGEAQQLMEPVLRRESPGTPLIFLTVRLALLASFALVRREGGMDRESLEILTAYLAVAEMESPLTPLSRDRDILMLVRE